MAIKTLTRASDGASIPVVMGSVLSAKAQGSGTLLLLRNTQGTVDPLVVTEAVATVVSGTLLFPVTPIVPFGSVSSLKYIRVDTVAGFAEAPGGSLLTLLSSDRGYDQGESLAVTESVATIQARIDAAIIAAGGGGSSGSYETITATGTTQGTAAATTASTININGGASGRAIKLDAATVSEARLITNGTSTHKLVFPATGGTINGGATNASIVLEPYQSIVLHCTTAGDWTQADDVAAAHVAGSGTVQGGGAIPASARFAVCTVTSGNSALTLPAATVGKTIAVTVISGSISGRLFPASGERIDGTVIDVHQFIPVGTTKVLRCGTAGIWTTDASSIETLRAAIIAPTVSGGPIRIQDPAAFTDLATFSVQYIRFDKMIGMNLANIAAFAGGGQTNGTMIEANHTDIDTVASYGDSVTLSSYITQAWVTNLATKTAAVYCSVGAYMNGTINDFVLLPPGMTMEFTQHTNTLGLTEWKSKVFRAGSQGSTASVVQSIAGGTPIVSPGVEVLVCANNNDAYTLDKNFSPRLIFLRNRGANKISVFAPAGGTVNLVANTNVNAAATAHIFSNDGLTWFLV